MGTAKQITDPICITSIWFEQLASCALATCYKSRLLSVSTLNQAVVHYLWSLSNSVEWILHLPSLILLDLELVIDCRVEQSGYDGLWRFILRNHGSGS